MQSSDMQLMLSICIPTYNSRESLGRCIDSIVNQSAFSDKIEIIISDNASEDTTMELIGQYQIKYKNIQYFRNITNIGANKNILKVSGYASGEYIWFMGSDDQVIEGGLSKVIGNIKTNSDIVFFQTNILPESNEVVFHSDGITYFKSICHQKHNSSVVAFATFLPTLIVQRNIFVYNLERYGHLFEGDSYSHTCILLRCIFGRKIGLMGNIIIPGENPYDLNNWKNNPKKWYQVVITHGVDRFYTNMQYFREINFEKDCVDLFKKHLLRAFKIVRISFILKRIYIYPVVSYIWRKYFL